MLITKEAFETWRHSNPVTRELFSRFEAEIQQLIEEMGAGRTIDYESADRTLALTAKQVGNIEGLTRILNTFHDGDEVDEDD